MMICDTYYHFDCFLLFFNEKKKEKSNKDMQCEKYFHAIICEGQSLMSQASVQSDQVIQCPLIDATDTVEHIYRQWKLWLDHVDTHSNHGITVH